MDFQKRVNPSVGLVIALFCAGCTTNISKSSLNVIDESWFFCDVVTDCVVVTDKFCKQKAVNVNYAGQYQDTRTAQLSKHGEIRFCEPSVEHAVGKECFQNQCMVGEAKVAY